MKTTIVVSPRERFTSILDSLDSLFSTIPPQVRVIVVEGGSPKEVLKGLKKRQKTRPFELISFNYMILPQEARNIGFDLVTTEYVVFADNDVHFEPGWLEALENNADAHKSDLVAPLICIGPPKTTKIHHAGGELIIQIGDSGKPFVREHHRLSDRPITELSAARLPVTNEIVEFHCYLARTDYIRRIGPIDERMITREQIDLGLRSKYFGGKVTFEQKAVVTYMAITSFAEVDLPYLSFRWSDRLAVDSINAFTSIWGIETNRDVLINTWIRPHRLRAYKSCFKTEFEALGTERFIREVLIPKEQAAVTAAFSARPDKPLRYPTHPSTAEAQAFFKRLETDPVVNRSYQPVFMKRQRPLIVAGMSTHPDQLKTFWTALESLLPQVDRLYLFLDNFAIPPKLDHEKIVLLPSQLFGDIGENGKFLGLTMSTSGTYYFAVDSTVRYPSDYCYKMISHLRDRGHRSIIGVQGSQLRRNPSQPDLIEQTTTSLTDAVPKTHAVDMLGSLAFNLSTLKFDVRGWKTRHLVDVHFALTAASNKIPLELIAREEHWLTYIDGNSTSPSEDMVSADPVIAASMIRDLFDLKAHSPVPVALPA